MDPVSEEKIRSGRVSGELEIQIAPLSCRHLEAVLEVVALSAEKRWERQDFAYFLSHATNCSAGVFASVANQQRLIAFCLALRTENTVDIIYIATAPAARQLGMARRLLHSYQDKHDIERITLEVAEGNLPAVGLYSASGFLTSSRRKRYYENRYDALRMEWSALRHSVPGADLTKTATVAKGKKIHDLGTDTVVDRPIGGQSPPL